MPLVDLQTNLKDLKYGKDRVDGGDSGQPYIQTDIPANRGDSNLDLPGNEDFIIRGGLYAFKNTVDDVLRLGKYFSDVKNPSGLLFVAKQNLLSRTAVRTETSGILNENIYTPLSTLAQAGVEAFGLHLNKQGLNPIPDSIFSIDTYRKEIQYDQYEEIQNRNSSYRSLARNRLVALFRVKILDDLDEQRLNGIIIDPDDTEHLLAYGGGPGSILGIGKTKFKFSCTTPLWARYNRGLDFFDGRNGQTDRGDIIFDDDDDDEIQMIQEEEDAIIQEAGNNTITPPVPCPDPPVTVYTVAPGPASSPEGGATPSPPNTGPPPSAVGSGPVSSYGDAAERAAKPSEISSAGDQLRSAGSNVGPIAPTGEDGRAVGDEAPSSETGGTIDLVAGGSSLNRATDALSTAGSEESVGLPFKRNTLSAMDVEDPSLPDFTPIMMASNTSQNRPYEGTSLSNVMVTDNQTGETRPLSEMMMDPNGPGLSGIMAQSAPGQRYSFGLEEVTIIGELSKPKGPEYATPEIVSQTQNPSPVPEPSSGPSGTPPPNPTPTEGVPPLLQRPEEGDKPCPDAPIIRGTVGSERKRKRQERKEARKKLRQERRERRRLRRKNRRRVKKLIRAPKPMF